jgi:hypothetical protein
MGFLSLLRRQKVRAEKEMWADYTAMLRRGDALTEDEADELRLLLRELGIDEKAAEIHRRALAEADQRAVEARGHDAASAEAQKIERELAAFNEESDRIFTARKIKQTQLENVRASAVSRAALATWAGARVRTLRFEFPALFGDFSKPMPKKPSEAFIDDNPNMVTVTATDLGDDDVEISTVTIERGAK